MSNEVRACIFCRHCTYEEPRCYASGAIDEAWDCSKDKFKKDNKWSNPKRIDTVDFYQLALSCDYFELRDDLKNLPKR